MLLAKLPRELIESKNEVELTVKMIVGAPICLKGADNEDSLRGAGLSFVVLDEYAMMKRNVWQEIVRPMLTDTKGRALFIGTPQGKNALWELFIKGQRKENEFSSYQFKTIDNPFIDPQEVEQARTQLSETYFKQEYEASFEDYTGLIWPEFTEKHLIEPYPIPQSFPKIAAIDPAMSGTTAVLKSAIDEDGNLIIYSEYYEQNKRVSEVAEVIKDNLRWFIDPASASRNMTKDGQLYSLFNEYGDNGIYATPGENDVEAGINRVAEYFKSGKIKIFKTCKNLVYEIERYHWSEERETVSGIMKPKPFKSMDHLCDCLRYLVMSRSQNALKPQPKVTRDSVAYEMERQEREAKNWRTKYA
jgi:PBSX family phage terminase large subunit